MFRIISLFMLLTFVLSNGASGCHAKQNAALPTQTPNTETSTSVMKVLAEGFHSSITNPFIAVVRDSETYAALSKLGGNVPKLGPDFFEGNAVIAAFLGERNTGGYSVEITREANGDIRIAEKMPGKGVMVPQMITSPFKIVSVSVAATPLLLALDSAWRRKMRPYRITRGTFTMTGGFAGTSEKFELNGEMRIMRETELATFAFAILSSGPAKKRSLIEFATGIVESNGEITINKMSADSLVNPPNSGLKATGAFTAGDNKISLNFSSLPSMIADGYQGEGTLEAELVGSW